MRIPRQHSDHTPPRNRRLTPELYADEGHATLITIRADRGTPFAGNPALCRSTLDLLRQMRLDYGCWLGAYCLMPDHLHFVAGPAAAGSSVLVYAERFKGKSTNQSWTCGWSGRLWQKRFHDHVLREAESLNDVYAYVLHNPVRAGLIEAAEAWPWSGIVDHYEW